MSKKHTLEELNELSHEELVTVILTMQDVCGYKGQTRINVTGTVDEKNWTWKLKDFKTFPAEMEKSKQWIEQSGRADQNTEKEIQLDIE